MAADDATIARAARDFAAARLAQRRLGELVEEDRVRNGGRASDGIMVEFCRVEDITEQCLDRLVALIDPRTEES